MPPISKRIADSRRDLRHEIVFKLKGRPAETLPNSRFLVSLEISNPAQGAWSGSLELFDEEGGYLEELSANISVVEYVTLRFWEDGQVAPYFVGGVVGIEPDFRPEGVGLRLELVATGIREVVLDLKPRGWPENTNPATIIRDIAADHGWKLVDSDNIPTVVDCATTIGTALQTTEESDIAFIIGRVLPQSHDAAGKHFTFRLSTGNPVIVYFHSVAAPVVARVRRSYTYLRDPNGEVIRFTPKNDMVGAWLLGGGNAQIEAVDSAQGAATSQKATVVRGFKGVVVPESSAYATPPADGTTSGKRAVIGRTAVDSAAFANVHWSKVSEASIEAELEVIGTHDVNPGEYVEVNYYRKDNTVHPTAGTFRVILVTHTFGMGGWVTLFNMVRSGNQHTPASVKMELTNLLAVVPTEPADVSASSIVRPGGSAPRNVGQA